MTFPQGGHDTVSSLLCFPARRFPRPDRRFLVFPLKDDRRTGEKLWNISLTAQHF